MFTQYIQIAFYLP